MALLKESEYLAFASFTFAATTYNIGTVPEFRGGVQYEGVILTAPQLAMQFGDEASLAQASNVDLVIGDGAGGVYRTLYDANILDGTVVTITLVTRQTWNDGTTTELTYAQQLTIVGGLAEPGKLTLHMQDLEDGKLQALYPPNTWQSADWPELSSDDAGQCICEPVGTALKFRAVLLHSDTVNNEYWYGVCTGSPKLYAITAQNVGTKQFTVTGNLTGVLSVGSMFVVTGTTSAIASDNRYTVAAIAYGASTVITTNEALTASTGGSVRLMPQVLTVYRNKRVISAVEYIVQQGASGVDITNGSFSAGLLSPWTNGSVGTGSVTVTVGNCAIAGTNSSNFGSIGQLISAWVMKQVFVAVEVTVAAGADATIYGGNIVTTNFYRAPAGQTTTVLMNPLWTNNCSVAIAPWNFTGTTNITRVRIITYNLTLLKFGVPQIDFNGTRYAIEADCSGVEAQNASGEVQRLIGLAGATADATTFTAAKAVSFAQTADCDYGRNGQRTLAAIIADLLWLARAGLSRNSAGAYTIWQDLAGAASVTLDESAGDNVQLINISNDGRPTTVGLTYAPSTSDASALQIIITRPVTGGVLGAETPRDIRYLRDATTADQALCYRALRRQYLREATAQVFRMQANIGDIMQITCPRLWTGARTFTVWDTKRIKSGNELTLREYNAAVYTYTAAVLPPNAPTGYQPDYSFTAPLAPTSASVNSTGVRIANDGTTTSYALVLAIPPVVNWQQMWFAAVHNVTGEITLSLGSNFGGGFYSATLGPLRPGEVYKLQIYAVNSNGVQGVVQSTFDSSSIGGGPGVTTFTAAGQSTAPATVSSISVLQVMGSNMQVSWTAVAGTNIAQYVLERNRGGGAFSVIYSGLSTKFVDSGLAYGGSAYSWRVRAQDTYGNFSAAYATSSTATLAGNVSGGTTGDIGATTVATANRTNTTTVTSSWSTLANTFAQGVSVTHSLGRLPVLGAVLSGNTLVAVFGSSVSTTLIGLTVAPILDTSTATASVPSVPNTHAHNLTTTARSGTVSVDVW